MESTVQTSLHISNYDIYQILLFKNFNFSAQNDNALELMKSTKSLYDFTKTEDIERDSSDALPELIIDGFDDEQVNSIYLYFVNIEIV